jgi:hypothetical protein
MAMSNKAWWNTAYVSIQGLSGTEYQLRTKTTSFSQTGGNPDVEGLETFGGKITRLTSAEDIEISFEGIPTSHADFDWIYAGQTASTAFGASGAVITSSATTKYRVTMLWTDQPAANMTAATQAITGSNEAYRKAWADLYCTGVEVNMDAGDVLKATLSFKTTEEDSDGRKNWYVAAKDTTSGTLSALNAYTSSTTKW